MSGSLDIERIISICRRNDVIALGLFGSTARGDATEQSDVDLLVRFAHQKSLLAIADLQMQMEAVLGRNVDLVTESALSPYIRQFVLRDLRVIYESAA